MPRPKLNIRDFFIKSMKSIMNSESTYFIYENFLSESILKEKFNKRFLNKFKEYLYSDESYIIFQELLDNDKKRRQVIFVDKTKENINNNKWNEVYKVVNEIIVPSINKMLISGNLNETKYKIITSGLLSEDGCSEQRLHSDNNNNNKCKIKLSIYSYIFTLVVELSRKNFIAILAIEDGTTIDILDINRVRRTISIKKGSFFIARGIFIHAGLVNIYCYV